MRKMYLRVLSALLTLVMLLALLPTVAFAAEDGTSVAIDATNFPDNTFRNHVSKAFDKNKDGMLSQEEQDAVTDIFLLSAGITSLTGISYFKNLTDLSCPDSRLTELDVSQNTALHYLNCSDNQLTTLDLSKNTALRDLDCSGNRLTTLDLSQNTALSELICNANRLTELDVSHNPKLSVLRCIGNRLTVLDVSQNPELWELYCSNNCLTALDVSQNSELGELYCPDNALEIFLAADNTFDLSTLPDFDITKASHWEGGTVRGNILTFNKGATAVTYRYDCGRSMKRTFTLSARINGYVDVNHNAWYYDAVSFAMASGLFYGVDDTHFSPNGKMTRAMFVTVLWRLDGCEKSSAGNPFVDVDMGRYYADAVMWAAEHQIVAGIDATHFNPNCNMTREQVAAVLYRYLRAYGYDLSASADLSTFPDANQISNYAKENLAWAVGAGLISGSKDTATGIVYLNPKGNATRAQVAQILLMLVLSISE